MIFTKKEPIIFLIAGRARSGKNTVCEIIKKYYEVKNKKVIVSPYTKYLKKYIEEITGEVIDDDNKPRDLLQKISSEIIKKEMKNENFFINRQVEDLELYSYFFDYIIIPDVRFEKEIKIIKGKFKNVISIGVNRENYDNGLTSVQKQDITEVALDNYNEYDFKINNNVSFEELNNQVKEIIDSLLERGIVDE